jgi:uncharacterized protein YndB with AHSA1/START domain
VIFIIGSMTDNELVVRVSTAIAASPARVWEVLVDLSRYRDWHPNMELVATPSGTDLALAAGGVVRLRTNAGTAAELEFDVTITDVDEPSTLVWAGGDPDVFYGRHRFTLTPEGENTVLVNEETFTGGMAAAVLAENRAIIESQYAAGDAALKAVAEGE